MRIDPSLHEVSVIITGDRRVGVWAFESNNSLHKKWTRCAGQISTSASEHTLLLVALTNALRTVSKGQASRLVQFAPRGVQKPRVRVLTDNYLFADALNDVVPQRVLGDESNRRLRAGKNFLWIARPQLRRFTIDVQLQDRRDPVVEPLLEWARMNVIDPKMFPLAPSAVSSMA